MRGKRSEKSEMKKASRIEVSWIINHSAKSFSKTGERKLVSFSEQSYENVNPLVRMKNDRKTRIRKLKQTHTKSARKSNFIEFWFICWNANVRDEYFQDKNILYILCSGLYTLKYTHMPFFDWDFNFSLTYALFRTYLRQSIAATQW